MNKICFLFLFLLLGCTLNDPSVNEETVIKNSNQTNAISNDESNSSDSDSKSTQVSNDEELFKLIDSTKYFKLYKPGLDEEYSVETGVSFHGEIHESAIGQVKVELTDSNGATLNSFDITEDGFFDEGVFNEWTLFTMRVAFEKTPVTDKGIFRITDNLSGEIIEINIKLKN